MLSKYKPTTCGFFCAAAYFPFHMWPFLYFYAFSDALASRIWGVNTYQIYDEHAFFVTLCTSILFFVFFLCLKAAISKVSKSKIEVNYVTILVLLALECLWLKMLNNGYISTGLDSFSICANLFVICYFFVVVLSLAVHKLVKIKDKKPPRLIILALVAIAVGSVINVGVFAIYGLALGG